MNAVVFDNLFPPELIRAASDWWPPASWPGWIAYDAAYECKRASDRGSTLPAAIGVLLARMAALPVGDWFPGRGPLTPDLSLWGAGLHEMPAGPGLTRHLDADTHPRLGLRRELSAVLWVHERWEPEWGGKLALESGLVVRPMPGRLCIFSCGNEWHEVRPVMCPEGVTRRSLAMFWYAAEPGDGARPRAVFAGHAER